MVLPDPLTVGTRVRPHQRLGDRAIRAAGQERRAERVEVEAHQPARRARAWRQPPVPLAADRLGLGR